MHGTELHVHVWGVYRAIAELFEAQGESTEALKMYQKSLDLVIEANGPNDEEVAELYTFIAGLFVNRDDFAEAVKMFRKALDVEITMHGTEVHPEVASTYGAIASGLKSKPQLKQEHPCHLTVCIHLLVYHLPVGKLKEERTC